MNFANIKFNDIANGEGIRVSLFVSGCTHHCKNCFNQVAWDFSYGKEFTDETINEIVIRFRSGEIFSWKTKYINGYKKIITGYKTLSHKNGISLLEVRLFTGRTHQIRAQFASRGYPLVGDRRYGAPKESADGLALLSYKLSFPHPNTGESMAFELEEEGTRGCGFSRFL